MEVIKRETVKLRLTNELIKESCILSMKAHNHKHDYLTNYTNKKRFGSFSSSSSSPDVLIIAFKGSMEVDDFYNDDDHFGETDVDVSLFPSLQRISEGQLAKVNASFLLKFMNLLNNREFISEVENAVKKNKKVLFTGHSSGAATASFVTLWMLELMRKGKGELPIGCVTFGSPLIGDGTLTHAVRREKWADHFTHFVMEHDIVPRMMLAPKTSVQEYLPDILKFFQSHKSNTLNTKILEGFFENVLINASTVASHDAFDLMEPTNSLKEKLSVDFVKVSPYRPFGIYVFCTTQRQQLVVENPNAAMQLLFYLLQLPNEDQDLAQFVPQSLTENFGYEEELNNIGVQFEQWVNLKDLNQHLLAPIGTIGPVKNKTLFELAASAKWCLLAVEEAEMRKQKNMDQVKESMRKYKTNKGKIIEDLIVEILAYKKKHADGNIDYYEAFKLQEGHEDFEANVNRLEQAKIWDVIVEMVRRKDLPDDFEVWDELVDLGTQFRRLYEPLDIANYFRHDKGEDTGARYMSVRPKRYKFTQRWYEHKNVTAFESDSESNFVAEYEELMKEVITPKKKTTEEVMKDFESIKNKAAKWKSDDEKIVKKEDVFWGESVLSKLAEKLA